MRPSKWSLGARISALCLPVVLLLTLLAVAAAVTAAGNSARLDDVFNKIGQLRTDSQSLEAALLDQETGIRGYAIDGTAADLVPYNDGLAAQTSLVADLRAHIGGHHNIGRDVDSVQGAIDTWRANVAVPIMTAIKAGDHRAALALIDPSARDRFDAVRAVMTTLLNDVVTLRNTAVADVQRSSRAITWTLIAAVSIVIIAGLVLAVLLRRMVSGPVTRLAADVRLVAAGDYNHTVDGYGPPELAALGADVEEMRRRVVADLRLVQSANDAVERANAQLEQQAIELQRSNQDLEQFAYVASHDLQEPLRKVASFCQLLQRRYSGQLDERADQYISFVVDGAHRMQRLINDLLEFSRIGRITAGFTEVDLAAVADNAAAAHEMALTRSGGSISVNGLPTVHGEEQLLTALLTNLVGNSVKFRRPDVPVRIEITAERVGAEWQIVCRDNGIGIESAYAEKVFVIFQRLHSRDAFPGTGIGLAVAKRIVEYHGGRIWVDTVAGEGAAICFTLPITSDNGGSPDVT